MIQARLDESDGKESERVINSLEKIKSRVRNVLEKYPSAKGDYRILWYYYVRSYCPKIRIRITDFEALRAMPSPESISRNCRFLQESGEFEASARVQRKRKRLENLQREYWKKG